MSFLALIFKGVWSSAFASLFMHYLMGFASYTLSAKIYSGLYFFIYLIASIANPVLNLRPL